MLTGFHEMKFFHKNRFSKNGMHLENANMKTRIVVFNEMLSKYGFKNFHLLCIVDTKHGQKHVARVKQFCHDMNKASSLALERKFKLPF